METPARLSSDRQVPWIRRVVVIKVGHASATLPSVRLLRSGSWRVTGGLLALARADAGRKPGRRPSPDVIAYIDPSLPVESYLIDEAGHGIDRHPARGTCCQRVCRCRVSGGHECVAAGLPGRGDQCRVVCGEDRSLGHVDRERTHRTAPMATAPTKTKDPTLTKPVSANSWRYSLRARWARPIRLSRRPLAGHR